jgi:hypothetical protein
MSEFSPVQLEGGNLMLGYSQEAWHPWHDGRYYQPHDEHETKARRDAAREWLNDPSAIARSRISEYQKWVELDWKTQHGTYSAFERFSTGFLG